MKRREPGPKAIGKNKYLLDFRMSNGRRKRITVNGPKSLAQAIWNDIQVKKYKREYLGIIEVEKITLKDYIDKYLNDYAFSNKSNREARTERYAFNANIIPFFGSDIYLTEITPYLMERFKAKRIQEVSPATVNRNIQYLKHAFKMAIEWNYLKDNPATTIKKLKESPGRLRWLRPAELDSLVSAANRRMQNMILFVVNTGLRAGELMSLKWDDVIYDSIEGNVQIDSNVDLKYLDYSKGGIYIRESKNNTSRIIPMNEIVLKVINDLSSDNEYVFGGISYRYSFESARKKAQLTDFRFHDLRHTFASYLIMNGVDIRTIQYLLGHKDIKMTMRYSHLSRGHLQEAVDRLNKVFSMDRIWTPCETDNKKEVKQDA